MKGSRFARAFAIASLMSFAAWPAASAPPPVRTVPQVQTAPPPVMANPKPQRDVQPAPPEQFTSLAVTVSTGDDDLRSGSTASVTLYFAENWTQRCNIRPNGETWDNGSTHDSPPCVFPVPVTWDQLKKAQIILSYDGGSGLDMFHTQDNWNVNEVRIEAQNSSQHVQKCLIDASKNPYLVRFTGNTQAFDLGAAPNSC